MLQKSVLVHQLDNNSLERCGVISLVSGLEDDFKVTALLREYLI